MLFLVRHWKEQRNILVGIARLVFVVTLLLLAAAPQPARAHGGVIMDGGFTDEYEWLVLSVNSPLVQGENLMSLVLYDVQTFAPINGMRVEVLIRHQSSDALCCNAEDHVGPIELEADPENWPGDYSYDLPFDQFGNFDIQFTAYEGDSEEVAIQVVSTVLVLPNQEALDNAINPNSPLDPPPDLESPLPEPSPFISTTATVAISPTVNATPPVDATPTAAPTTEETPTAEPIPTQMPDSDDNSLLGRIRSRWYLWAALAIIPLVLFAFLLMRPSMDELVAQKEAELAEEDEEDLEEESKEDLSE